MNTPNPSDKPESLGLAARVERSAERPRSATPASDMSSQNSPIRELLDAVEELRRHAMYPHPDCSDEKKMAFINACSRLDAAIAALPLAGLANKTDGIL